MIEMKQDSAFAVCFPGVSLEAGRRDHQGIMVTDTSHLQVPLTASYTQVDFSNCDLFMGRGLTVSSRTVVTPGASVAPRIALHRHLLLAVTTLTVPRLNSTVSPFL